MGGRYGEESPGRVPPGDGPGGPSSRAPGDGRGWFEPDARKAVTEPTQVLPHVPAPRSERPSPMVVARAVIVYQERPRRPWALWVFTVALVALTVGVVLGQTAAFEPVYRPAGGAQAVAAPTDVVSSAPSPSPLGQAGAGAPPRLTAPLGAVRSRVLEVVGSSTVLRVRSADLGEALLDIASTDSGTVPSLTDSERGSRVELVRAGDAGPANVEIKLNAKVSWTLRLLGSSSEQTIDMRTGRVAGVEVAGGTARVVVHLPKPKGTVPLSVTGPMGELAVRTKAGTPVRVRLGGGSDKVVVDGKTRRRLKAGAEVTSAGWAAAKNRYDVVAADAIASVVTEPSGG